MKRNCARSFARSRRCSLVQARPGRSSPLRRRASASAPAWPNWNAAISQSKCSSPFPTSGPASCSWPWRYELKPYRLHRQRVTTVMLRVPKRFVDQVLWPEFQELNAALMQYLNEVTTRVIREEVHRDTSEAAEAPPALPAR